MKQKHFIYIKCKAKNPNRILLKLFKNRINVYDVVKKDSTLYLKVDIEDYERIQKELVTIKFSYVSDSGLFKIKKMITPLKIFAFSYELF